MPPKASTSAAGAAAASAKKLSPVELKLLNAGLAARGGVRTARLSLSDVVAWRPTSARARTGSR